MVIFMPVANPEYRVHWQSLHDHHSAERMRISEVRAKLVDQNNAFYESGLEVNSPELTSLEKEIARLDEEFHEHQRVCLRCLDTYQHKTIQDAAQWYFNHFSNNFVGQNILIHQIDFEKLQSLEEVRKAFNDAIEIST